MRLDDDDLTDEFRAHIAQRADDLVRSGLPRDQAERRARLEFGAVEAYKEQCRDAARQPSAAVVAGQVGREFLHAGRRLRATPVFTIFAVLSIALGLGITTAFYSVMSVLLWPASGLDRPGELAVLRAGQTLVFGYSTARADFDDLRAAQTTMAGVAGWTNFSQPFIDGDIAERFRGEAVTGNAFDLLGVRVAAGRPIQEVDDEASASAVIVLSHQFWSTRMRKDPSGIGRVVHLGGQPFQVIGVASQGFKTIGRPDLEGPMGWIPLEALRRFSSSTPPALDPNSRTAEALSAIGRLRPGRTMEEASAELAAIGARLDAVVPIRRPTDPVANIGSREWPRRWFAMRADDAFSFRESSLVWLLVALVALVLVVACTNLANLMLARGSARRHEFAVRRALGASRGRLLRELLAESAIVAVAGGAAAALLVRVILVAAAAEVPPGVQFDLATDLAPDVMAAGSVALVLTLAVFGLWPAWQIAGQDPRTALAADAGTSGAFRWRARRRLIMGQVAVSAGFLVFAVMCIGSISAETSRASGIVPVERLAIARFNFRAPGWDEAKARRAAARVLDLAAAQPEIEVAAITTGFPLGFTWEAELTQPAEPFDASRDSYPASRFISATPQIFRVLGVPILRGRAFDGRDVAGAPPVAVITESAARQVFGTAEAVGRQVLMRIRTGTAIWTAGRLVTIAGVAGDAVSDTRGGVRGAIYVPFAQHFEPGVELAVRTARDPEDLLIALRTWARQADPDLFADRSVTGLYRLDPGRWGLRYFGGVASLLGAVALALAMAGLFGVLSHLVSRRMREMGLRLALGATRAHLARLVLVDGVRPVAFGLVLGGIGGAVGRLVFEPLNRVPIGGTDLFLLALVPLMFVASALVACYLPARRAARVDPNAALRDL